MLRKFKKQIQNSKILDEYKERRYFVKPSVKKRIANNKAKYNASITA